MTKVSKNTDVSGSEPEVTAAKQPAESADHSSETNGKRPVWSRQINRVNGSIWPHVHEGQTRYSVSINRSYLDRRNNQWKRVSAYDRKDLQDLRSLCNEADAELLRLEGMVHVTTED